MNKGEVVILGINGHVGRHAAEAFLAAGWQVTGMGRSQKHAIPGVRFVKGDAESVGDMRRAIGNAGVVFNGLNLRYDQWFDGRLEALMARVLEAMGTDGKTMLYPGSIYNYAPSLRLVTPDAAQNPPTPRGVLRMRVEEMFRAAAKRGDVQVLVLRAGDFFGPRSSGDWFDQAILREAGRNKVSVVGQPGIGHSWAYLPDLARAFEAVASVRGSLAAYDSLHFAGHFVTPEQMASALRAAVPGVRVGRFPWTTVTLMGLFNPVMRDVAKMGYLWRAPMELRGERLAQLLGAGFGTPFDEAIRTTVWPVFNGGKELPQDLEPASAVPV